ncbi:MAG: hypothetical protein ACJ748_02645 [Flavisolibacter sp.]
MLLSKKFIVVFLLVSFFSFIVYYTTYKPYLGCDDAYIYFVYAKNLAKGYGMVYNAGGERVEGFTSLSWMLIISLLYIISSHFQVLLILLNIVLISWVLYRLVAFIDRYFVSRPVKWISFPSILFLLTLFIIKGYLDWTIFSLMETGYWSWLLLLISIFLIELAAGEEKEKKQRIQFAVLLSLLVLARPESFLWGTVFLVLYGWILYLRGNTVSEILKKISFPFILFVLTIAGLELFRLYYFGYPLPNTFYAKVSEDKLSNIKEGLIYIFKFIYVYPFYFLPIAISFIYALVLIRNIIYEKKEMIAKDHYMVVLYVTILLILTSLVVPIVNGGDHFSLFRLIQPVVPLFIFLLFNPVLINKFKSLIVSPSYTKWAGITGLILVLPLIYLMNIPKYGVNVEKTPYKASLLNDFSFAESYKQESYLLNDFFNFTPRPSIGRIWAGGYAYGYEGETVDLMGLNNTAMAHAQKIKVGLKNHASFDKQAFYKLHPDLLNGTIVKDTTGFEPEENKPDFEKGFEYGVFKGIYKDSEFIHTYTPVLIGAHNKPFFYFSYVRNNYIDSLRNHNMTVTILERKKK